MKTGQGILTLELQESRPERKKQINVWNNNIISVMLRNFLFSSNFGMARYFLVMIQAVP